MSIASKTTIKSIGLPMYLDDHKAEHDDHGYIDFHQLMLRMDDPNEPIKITKSDIARVFHVSRPTVNSWIEIYRKERSEQ